MGKAGTRALSWYGRCAGSFHVPADSSDALNNDDLLTAREHEILALVGTAMSNKEIAHQLKISDLTVKSHLHRVYVKLQRSGRYRAFMSSGALTARSQHGRDAPAPAEAARPEPADCADCFTPCSRLGRQRPRTCWPSHTAPRSGFSVNP